MLAVLFDVNWLDRENSTSRSLRAKTYACTTTDGSWQNDWRSPRCSNCSAAISDSVINHSICMSSLFDVKRHEYVWFKSTPQLCRPFIQECCRGLTHAHAELTTNQINLLHGTVSCLPACSPSIFRRFRYISSVLNNFPTTNKPMYEEGLWKGSRVDPTWSGLQDVIIKARFRRMARDD